MATDTSKQSQCKQLLRYLRSGRHWISPLKALFGFGIERLGARIWDLKEDGHKFNERWAHNEEKRWKEFQLKR